MERAGGGGAEEGFPGLSLGLQTRCARDCVSEEFFLVEGLGEAEGYVRTGLFVALGLVSWRDWKRSWDSVLAMRVLVLNRSAMAFSWYTVAAHFMPRDPLQHTLLNQSDISDFVEKSFSSCD